MTEKPGARRRVEPPRNDSLEEGRRYMADIKAQAKPTSGWQLLLAILILVFVIAGIGLFIAVLGSFGWNPAG